MTLTFGSLFAGIGGFDLGFERAGLVCKWQVEIDSFCRKVLAKHWPDVRRHDDVRTFPEGDPEAWKVDVICGGFPCQDISLAGRRAGLKGERSGLWWEFARIVRLLRPRYVVVENVPGLLAAESEEEQAPVGCVLGELAECGYNAEWACIPASAFGSTQQRYRVFIIAYPQGQRDGFRVLPARWREEGEGAGDLVGSSDGVGANCFGPWTEHDADPYGERSQEEWLGWRPEEEITADLGGQGAAEVAEPFGPRAPSQPSGRDSPFVGSGWWDAEPQVVRMVHGIPRRLVRDSIRGLGNCVVPQVAKWIGRRLIEAAG
jgi:DNA (cytosine-5)-methyltransferase 1